MDFIKKNSKLLLIAALALIILLFAAIKLISGDKNPALTGTWDYQGNTQYTFDGRHHGAMDAGGMHFDYTYKLRGNKLKLNFADDIVEDATYFYGVQEDTLTLVGDKGTVGGTYELTRLPD